MHACMATHAVNKCSSSSRKKETLGGTGGWLVQRRSLGGGALLGYDSVHALPFRWALVSSDCSFLNMHHKGQGCFKSCAGCYHKDRVA